MTRLGTTISTTASWSGNHPESLCTLYQRSHPLTNFFIFFYSLPRPRVLLQYLYSVTVRSAAPQTAQLGGPGPRFAPGTDDPEAGTRPPHLIRHHNSLKLTFLSNFIPLLQNEVRVLTLLSISVALFQLVELSGVQKLGQREESCKNNLGERQGCNWVTWDCSGSCYQLPLLPCSPPPPFYHARVRLSFRY